MTSIPEQMPPGMNEFEYLVCDGGPHLVLPRAVSTHWKGMKLLRYILGLTTDYGRACAAIRDRRLAVIEVGPGQAIVLAGPPMSAWGRSPEGWIDLYYLDDWSAPSLDLLIKRAVAAVPTHDMTDTGYAIKLTEPDMTLLFAGEQLGETAYGQFNIPIAVGSYRILEGQYQKGCYEDRNKDTVIIYRLKPIEAGGSPDPPTQ